MNIIRLGTFAAAVLCAALLHAATTYNYWQAVDGEYSGRWGDPAHWSEGHVPADGEYATIDPTRDAPNTVVAFSIEVDGDYSADTLVVGDPDNVARKTSVTFTGSGTVTCSGSSGHIFRACTATVFDGPTFRLGGTVNVLNYTPLTVKGGSTLWLNATLTFWKSNDYLTVDEGGTVDVAGVWYNNVGARTIAVNAGGRFVCRGMYRPFDGTENTTPAFGLVVNGGDAQVGELKLTRAAAYVRMTAGSLYLVNKPTLCDQAQLQISGGRLRYGFDVLQDESDPYYALAMSHGWAGCKIFQATNGVTFTCHDTFYVSQLRIYDSGKPARIDCDRIVFDGYNYPFMFQYSGNRNLHLYGPTDLYVDGNDLKGFNNHYIHCHGRVTVHTEDWSDPAVKRSVAIRGLGSSDGSLDLVATGGGTFTYGQLYSYETIRSFTVEEGTALVLGNRDVKVGSTTEWGPLVAETLTLESGVTVSFSAGEQHIAASTWNIDPSVRITVTIPATYTSEKVALASGAFPVLQDLDSKSLPDALLSQIALAGNADGWSLVNENGQISVVKADASQLGTFGELEWLGGSDSNWSTAANWNGGTPAEQKDYVFGASENRSVTFDKAAAAGGTTLGSIEFKECATRSIFIGNGSQITFAKSPAIKSSSHVPQVVSAGFRWTGGQREVASYQGGPIVLPASSRQWEVKSGSTGTFAFTGDVRTGNRTCSNVGSLGPQANRAQFPSHRTCFTVLDGGSMTFGNQAAEFASENSTFRVSRGGTLTFSAASGAVYSWARHPASIVVDGTLNLGPALRGGVDQVYRGAGTLNVTGGSTPYRAPSRVKFADALTVNLASDWGTEDGTFALALGVTAGSPLIRVPSGWTYGVPSGVVAATDASARAFALENGAVAVVDPQGGVATIKEAVSGEGTLAVTNGTLVLAASTDSSEAKIAACAGAALRFTASQRFAELVLATGAVATVSAELTLDTLSAKGAQVDLGAAQTLRMTGDVDVSDVDFAFTAGTGGWRTLVRADGAITGTPAHADRWAFRTVADSGATLLQASQTGMLLIIK